MKKIIIMLCFIQSSILLAQTETVVSPNGKKISINSNPVRTADNGLTATTTSNTTNLQLGGNLTAPTILTTSEDNTLSINGLQTGIANDFVAILDENSILRNENQSNFKTEPWYVSGSTVQATLNSQNIYQTGNIGIGTEAPATKLHIKSDTAGAIKIQDGTQTDGAFLTTDANGAASWNKPVKIATMIKGTIYNVGSLKFTFTNLLFLISDRCRFIIHWHQFNSIITQN